MACLLFLQVYYGVIFVDTAVPFLKFYLAFVAELLRTARTTSNIDSFKGLSKKLIPRKLTNLQNAEVNIILRTNPSGTTLLYLIPFPANIDFRVVEGRHHNTSFVSNSSRKS